MNKAAVQEVYDRLKQPRDIDFIKGLGFKSCVFYDLFGSGSVAGMSDTDLYIKVEQKLQDLCEYALNSEPVAKDCNGNGIYIGSKVYCWGIEFTVKGYKKEKECESVYCETSRFDDPIWLVLDDTVTVGMAKTKEEVLRDTRDALMVALDNLKKETIASLEKTVESLREAQKD